MEKLQRVAKLFSFLFLLLLIPFISASLKSSYLYFILNLLIIVLGVEAMSTKPNQVAVASHPSNNTESVGFIRYDFLQKTVLPLEGTLKVGKKIIEVVEKVQKLKRCASRPSIFFIGSCDVEEEENEKALAKELEAAGEIMSKQELFLKAEMFIGNFYKQLRMQRDQVLEED